MRLIDILIATVNLHHFELPFVPVPVEYPLYTSPLAPLQASPTRPRAPDPKLRDARHVQIGSVHPGIPPARVVRLRGGFASRRLRRRRRTARTWAGRSSVASTGLGVDVGVGTCAGGAGARVVEAGTPPALRLLLLPPLVVVVAALGHRLRPMKVVVSRNRLLPDRGVARCRRIEPAGGTPGSGCRTRCISRASPRASRWASGSTCRARRTSSCV